MRGLSELFSFLIGLFWVSGYLFMLFTFVQSGIDPMIDPKPLENEMDAADLAKMVDSCLKQDGDYIDVKFLESNSGRSICEVCGHIFPNICRLEPYAVVTSLNDGTEYSFGFPIDKTLGFHEIFVNIGSGGGVGVGRLVIKI